MTASTTSTGAAYRRAASAAGTSVTRTHSPSDNLPPSRRGSLTIYSSGSSTAAKTYRTLRVRSTSSSSPISAW